MEGWQDKTLSGNNHSTPSQTPPSSWPGPCHVGRWSLSMRVSRPGYIALLSPLSYLTGQADKNRCNLWWWLELSIELSIWVCGWEGVLLGMWVRWCPLGNCCWYQPKHRHNKWRLRPPDSLVNMWTAWTHSDNKNNQSVKAVWIQSPASNISYYFFQ